ncbi:MAG: glycosyltransferase [Nocardiopsaceae bacterium]|nr:glycosyltransferase [Nocardiopsaceae bacterium]
MKIAMVSEHASPMAVLGGADAGGQNVHVAELARELGARGHEVAVYTRRTSEEQPGTAEFAPGVRVHHVPAGPPHEIAKDRLPEYMPAFGAYLAAQWAHDAPDIVHAHYWMSGLAALQGAADIQAPVMQTFHALGTVKRRHQGPHDTSPREREEAELSIANRCAGVIATSVEERRELRSWGVPGERIDVVPCGVDAERFRPAGAVAERGDRPRVLSLGRLVPRKGVDTIVRAMAAVPEAELVVAGGPPSEALDADPETARLRAIAEQAGVADRVRFIGCVARADVPALLRSADIAVNVPWYEPFGMSTIEAMACGAPVIASSVGGHLDTMIQNVTGRLIPPSDPRTLAFWVRTLLADPVLKESYGIAAADRAAARYTWPLVARQTEDRYTRVLLRHHGGQEPGSRSQARHAVVSGGA